MNKLESYSMLEKKSPEISLLYSGEIKSIMGVASGRAGIKPCHRECDNSCLSDSGDVLCEGYRGHTELTVTVKGTKLYMVRCQNSVECNY